MKNANLITRRDFVRLAGVAGVGALIAPNLAFEEAKKRNGLNSAAIVNNDASGY